MKKILLFLLPVVLLTSCFKKDYHNKIVGRSIAQSCPFMPLTDAVQAEVDAGNVKLIDHPGNPQVCDSVYTVEFTTYQKWQSGHKGSLAVGIIIVLIGMGIFIYITSIGVKGFWPLLISFGTILIGGSFIGGFYFFNTEREIRKADYVKYPGGDLETFWNTPAQTY